MRVKLLYFAGVHWLYIGLREHQFHSFRASMLLVSVKIN